MRPYIIALSYYCHRSGGMPTQQGERRTSNTGVSLLLFIYQKAEPDLGGQAFTGGKAGGSVCGGVPVIGRHRKQILHALPLQGEDGLSLNRPNKRKTVIFGLPYLVLIGVVVENLLQPEEMPRGGHRIDQMPARAQHTGKLGLRHR